MLQSPPRSSNLHSPTNTNTNRAIHGESGQGNVGSEHDCECQGNVVEGANLESSLVDALQDGCDAEEGEAEVKIPVLYAVGHTWRARKKVQ